MEDQPRCTAKAKSTGERCRRAPVEGFRVCRLHGVNKRDRIRRMFRRLFEDEAIALLHKWCDLEYILGRPPARETDVLRLEGLLDPRPRLCGARVRSRPGGRCERLSTPGRWRCHYHGGATPRRKIDVTGRWVSEQLERAERRLWPLQFRRMELAVRMGQGAVDPPLLRSEHALLEQFVKLGLL